MPCLTKIRSTLDKPMVRHLENSEQSRLKMDSNRYLQEFHVSRDP